MVIRIKSESEMFGLVEGKPPFLLLRLNPKSLICMSIAINQITHSDSRYCGVASV